MKRYWLLVYVLIVLVLTVALVVFCPNDFTRMIGIASFFYIMIPMGLVSFEQDLRLLKNKEYALSTLLLFCNSVLLVYPGFQLVFFSTESNRIRYFMFNTISFYVAIIAFLFSFFFYFFQLKRQEAKDR